MLQCLRQLLRHDLHRMTCQYRTAGRAASKPKHRILRLGCATCHASSPCDATEMLAVAVRVFRHASVQAHGKDAHFDTDRGSAGPADHTVCRPSMWLRCAVEHFEGPRLVRLVGFLHGKLLKTDMHLKTELGYSLKLYAKQQHPDVLRSVM